jgi:acetyltransferase-like isoleucine patch superfamily enzyme
MNSLISFFFRILCFLRIKIFYSNVCLHWTSTVELGVKIGKNGRIVIGKNCYFHSGSKLLPYGGNIVIGSNVSVNPDVILYGHGNLTIGDNVHIAAQTIIVPSNHEPKLTSSGIDFRALSKRGITIGNNVWIGSGVKVLDGVVVNDNSIIGAGSVVLKDVNSYSVVAGVPGKIIKILKSDE